MFVQDKRPRLLIDETEVSLGSVWIHDQSDPYPGGHQFRLSLPGSLAESWLSLRHQNLSALASLLSFWRMEQKTQLDERWLFVLNTIIKVTRMEQGVEIEGECSPFCSTLKCPFCSATVWANWLFEHCVRDGDGSIHFRCKDCSERAIVSIAGEDVAVAAPDGTGASSCRQSGMTHRLVSGKFEIALGKLRWVV